MAEPSQSSPSHSYINLLKASQTSQLIVLVPLTVIIKIKNISNLSTLILYSCAVLAFYEEFFGGHFRFGNHLGLWQPFLIVVLSPESKGNSMRTPVIDLCISTSLSIAT